MRRRVRILAWTCAAATGLISIGSLGSLAIRTTATETNGGTLPTSAPRYGLSTVGMSFPFAAAVARGFSDAARKGRAQPIIIDAKASVQKQANDIDDLIAQRPAGIAIMPLDSVIAQGWVARARAAGVPVAAVAALVGDPQKREASDVFPGLVALASQDEVAAGRAAGALAATLLPRNHEARIAIIEGAAGFPEVEQRARGFREGLTNAGLVFRIVATQPGNWTAEGGETACQNILAAAPDIDLFFNEADDMVLGCARAVRAAGSPARLIGVGGSKLAIASIKAGAIDGTVCFKPEALGALAFGALRHPPTAGAARFLTYPIPAVTRSTVSKCVGQW